MACPDLCTAAKCQELERRISALEQAIELLEASFEAHTQQEIPEAHSYSPAVTVDVNVLNTDISVLVRVDDSSDIDSANLPESNLKLDGSFQSDILTLTVADGESQDTAQVEIPIPEIPEATEHIESNLKLSASFQSEILTLSVADGESQDTAQVEIPIPEATEHIESNLKLSASFQSEILTLSVADGESQDTAQVEIPKYEPDIDLTLFSTVFENNGANVLVIEARVNDSSDQTRVELPRFEPEFSFDMSVSGNTLGVGIIFDGESILRSVELPTFEPGFSFDMSVSDNTLGVGIIFDGESILRSVELPTFEPEFSFDMSVSGNTLGVGIIFDGESILRSVELPTFEPFVTLDIFETGENKFTIKASVNGESDEDILTIDIPDMNCDELEEKLDRCCSEITNTLNNLSLQLTNAESIINQSVDEVYQQITIDVSGQIDSNLTCNFPIDDNGNAIPTHAQSQSEKITYSGTGIAGLHEKLKAIAANLTLIHNDVCKAVDPISSISVNDVYRLCKSNIDVNRDDYFDELGNEKFTNASEQYEAAITEGLNALIAETKYGDMIQNAVDGKLIEAPNNWIIPILSDFALIQGKINNKAICDIEIPDDPEVVSIVASDKVVKRSDGKILVLHFVTPANYPKRSRNSSYWQVQIPAALDEYDWCEHFETLKFDRGNCYAELKFKQFSNPVSGFFRDKDAADAYFDAVLGLTTATEKNRVYHEHKTPGTNIIERTTRPYRAFIESVNDAGQAICHVKYVPPKEPC